MYNCCKLLLFTLANGEFKVRTFFSENLQQQQQQHHIQKRQPTNREMKKVFDQIFGSKVEVSVEIDTKGRQHYLMGDEITGEIIFIKNQPVKVSAVKIFLVGTEWYQHTSTDIPAHKRSKTKVFCEEEFQVQLASKKIDAGETRFRFALRIPISTASNLDHPYAKVSHELRVEICFSGAPSTITIMPLGTHQIFPDLPPFTDKKATLFKDAYSIKVLRRASFLPGETVPLDIKLDNKSGKEISKMTLQLEQRFRIGSSKSPPRVLASTHISSPRIPIGPSSK